MDGWNDGPFQPFLSVFFCFVTWVCYRCTSACRPDVVQSQCYTWYAASAGFVIEVAVVLARFTQCIVMKNRCTLINCAATLADLLNPFFKFFFYLYLLAQPGQKCFWRLRKVLLRQLFHSTSQDVRLKMEIGDIWVINVWLLGLNPNWSCVVFKLLPR